MRPEDSAKIVEQGSSATGTPTPRVSSPSMASPEGALFPPESPANLNSTDIAHVRDLLTLGERLRNRLDTNTVVPPTETLRAIQVEGLNRLADFCAKAPSVTPDPDGLVKTHFSISTGGGKTGLFCMTANAAEMPTVVFVPFKELVRQTVRDAQRFAPNLKVGVFYGDEKHIPENPGLIVVTYDSAANFVKSIPPGMKFPIVFYDEAHMALTKTRLDIAKQIPGASVVIGFTGSPVYNELKQVSNHFGEPLMHVTTAEGIRRGQLSSTYSVILKTNIPVADTHINSDGERELTPDQRRKLGQMEARNQAVINLLEAPQVKGRGTIVTCMDTDHADELARKAEAAGLGPVGILHYQSEQDEAQLLADCRAGKIKTLFVVRKTVGIDLPNFEVLINARPTWSLPDAVQRTGRVVRLCNEIPDKVALVIDLVDDYTLAEAPITAISLLEGSVVLPEGAESDERSAKRIKDVQELSTALTLPEGWELIVTQERAFELLSGAEAPVLSRRGQGLRSFEDVRKVLRSIGIDSSKDFYDRGVDAVLKARIDVDDPPYAGSVRALMSTVTQTLCGRPDRAFRAGAFRVVLNALYGDESWSAARDAAKEMNEPGFVSRIIEKLATVPLANASTRVKTVGMHKSPEFDGPEQLRLLGISQGEVDSIDHSAVIPERILKKLLQLHPVVQQQSAEELSASRERCELVQDLNRTGMLDSIIITGAPRIERMNINAFRATQFTDPESGRCFNGDDVLKTFNTVDGGQFRELVQRAVGDPVRIKTGALFLELEADRSPRAGRTLKALSLLNSDGELLNRLRELELTQKVHVQELSSRYFRDPVNYPIPARDIVQCLAGRTSGASISDKLKDVVGLIERGDTATIVARINSWSVWAKSQHSDQQFFEGDVGRPASLVSPMEAVKHLLSIRPERSSQAYSKDEIERDIVVVRRWEAQTGGFLSEEQRLQIREKSAELIEWNQESLTFYSKIGEELRQLVGSGLREATIQVGDLRCEIRELGTKRPTYDIAAYHPGSEVPSMSGRLSLLSSKGESPWLKVDWAIRADESIENRGKLLTGIPESIRRAYSMATDGRECVNPVCFVGTRLPEIGPVLHRQLGATSIPRSSSNTPVAIGDTKLVGEMPTVIPDGLSTEDKECVWKAIKGVRVNQSFVRLMKEAEVLAIPSELKKLLAREERGTDFCRTGAEQYCEDLAKAVHSGSATRILATLITSPEHLPDSSLLRAAGRMLEDRFGTPLPELPEVVIDRACQVVLSNPFRIIGGREVVSRLLIPLLDQVKNHGITEGKGDAVAQPKPETSPPQTLGITPRDKLPSFGVFFTPLRELAGFLTTRGDEKILHSSPKCGGISEAEKQSMSVVSAREALNTVPRPRCCKQCGPADKHSQIPKIESAWMKTLEARVVDVGPWNK